jgi:transcriptional regulator with XRE-family HTH domain
MLEQDYDIYKKKQGLRIRLARRMISGMTQEVLAEKLSAELGFDFGDDVKVSRIERGQQDVTGRELAALSAVLNQPQAWLQGIEDDGMNAPIIHVIPWFGRPIDVYASDTILEAA